MRTEVRDCDSGCDMLSLGALVPLWGLVGPPRSRECGLCPKASWVRSMNGVGLGQSQPASPTPGCRLPFTADSASLGALGMSVGALGAPQA